MWKKHLLGVLVLLLLSSSALYSEVILTDEQAAELNQTLDELNATLTTQKQTLEEQQTIIESQQMTIEEQESLIEQQQNRTTELKALLEKQRTSSIMRSILTVISSVAVGLLIGLLL